MKRLKIYQICGYIGNPNAYDGPEDYNFTDIVGFDASLSLEAVKRKINKMLTPDNAFDAVTWTYTIIDEITIKN